MKIIKKKKIKEYKKCAQKIEYKTNSTISTILDPKTGKLVPKIDDIYYFLNEKEWKQLKECSKKYNIKIKTN